MTRRRAKGEGSLFKRKDGRWCARIYVNHNPLYKYSQSKGECADWLLEMRQKQAAGLDYAAGRVLLADYLARWLADIESQVAYKTIEAYRQQARDYLIPHLGQIRLDQLQPEQIQSMYSNIYANRSANTICAIHGMLHKALADALRAGLIGRNPADLARPPRRSRHESQTFTQEQAERFLSATEGERHQHLFFLALVTGMRAGELLGLQWKDVDWDNRQLNIRRQVHYQAGGRFEFTPPKSRQGRTLLVSDDTLAHLRQQQQIVNDRREQAGDRWTDNDLVFPARHGTPLRQTNVGKFLRCIVERAGLPLIRFHDLRHTNATLLLARNVNPKIVQERLGHASIKMTLDTYSHVIPPMQTDAAGLFDT